MLRHCIRMLLAVVSASVLAAEPVADSYPARQRPTPCRGCRRRTNRLRRRRSRAGGSVDEHGGLGAALLEKPIGDGNLMIVDARNGYDQFSEGHIPWAYSTLNRTNCRTRPASAVHAALAMKTSRSFARMPASTPPIPPSRFTTPTMAASPRASGSHCTPTGYNHVAILDGGANKWKGEQRAWTKDPAARVSFWGSPKPITPPTGIETAAVRGVCAFADLSKFRVRVHSLGQLPTSVLLDARSLAEYMGEDVRAKNAGHIPGATNIEWSALMTGKEHERVWAFAAGNLRHPASGGHRQSPEDRHLRPGRQPQRPSVFHALAGWGFRTRAITRRAGGNTGNRDDVECEK